MAGQHIRFRAISDSFRTLTSQSTYFVIYEISAFESSDGTGTDLLTGGIPSASSSEVSYPPAQAIDDNVSTRWTSLVSLPDYQWFSVDMLAEYQVDSFTVTTYYSVAGAAIATRLAVEESDDGIEWRRIAIVFPANTGAVQTFQELQPRVVFLGAPESIISDSARFSDMMSMLSGPVHLAGLEGFQSSILLAILHSYLLDSTHFGTSENLQTLVRLGVYFGHQEDIFFASIEELSSGPLVTLLAALETLRVGDPAAVQFGGPNSIQSETVVMGGIHEIREAIVSKLLNIREALLTGDPAAVRLAAIDSIQSDFSHIAGLEDIRGIVSARFAGLEQFTDQYRVIVSARLAGLEQFTDQYQKLFAGLEKLNEVDIYSAVFAGLEIMSEPAARVVSQSYGIYIDGVSVRHIITDCKITYDEQYAHNSIEISSTDLALKRKCDPDINSGQSRIEVQIGARSMLFTIEGLDMSGEYDFTINGRSLSIRDDAPYISQWTYSTEDKEGAVATCTDLTEANAISFIDADFPIFGPYNFEGSPVEAMIRIAETAGRIVRAGDDGTIIIRKKWPVRPVYLQEAASAADYSRENVISIDIQHEDGTEYNSVLVSGADGDGLDSPDIEVETPESVEDGGFICENKDNSAQTQLIVGDTAFIRVYWAGKVPTEIETYATSGFLQFVGEATTEHQKRVEFDGGRGSVDRPIDELRDVSWIGAPGSQPEGEPTWEKYGKELIVSDPAYAVADVSYMATYHRYAVVGSKVEQLIAVLSYAYNPPGNIRVSIQPGDNEAEPIVDGLLVDDMTALERGTAFLDDSIYDKKIATIQAVYDGDVSDGSLVYIRNENVDIEGIAKVRRATIIFDGPAIWHELEIVRPIR